MLLFSRRSVSIVGVVLLGLGAATHQLRAQSTTGNALGTTFLLGLHGGGLEGDAGGILSGGIRLAVSRLRLDLLPADIGVLPGSSAPGYTTDANGNCHGPDGRFVNKSKCSGTVTFLYGAATDLSWKVGPEAFPVTIGGGYRKGNAKSGAYATFSSPVTRETARWFSLTARVGPDLYTVGVVVSAPLAAR